MLDEVMKVIQMKENVNKRIIFQDFHKVCMSGKFVLLWMSGKFVLLWQSYLAAAGLDTDPLFYQQVLQEIFENEFTHKFRVEHS